MTTIEVYGYRREYLKEELLGVVNDTAGQPILTEESLKAIKGIIADIDYLDKEIEWHKEWNARNEAIKKGSLEDDKSLKADV